MHKLTISDGENSVVFPKTRKITHEGELEGNETTMGDGSEMFDIVGFRKIVTYVYDYLPQSIFDRLIPMLRKHKYVSSTYLDLDNTEKTQQFSVEYPSAEAFKLTANGAVWHNVIIKMRAKDVEQS